MGGEGRRKPPPPKYAPWWVVHGTYGAINQTDRDGFVGLRQHGNEHVDENDDHACTVRAEHEFTDELGQVVSTNWVKSCRSLIVKTSTDVRP